MKTLESRKRTNSNTACPKSNSTSFESCRTTGTKQRNVKQNTRGKQKWKVARLEKARERLRGGVCYFANNPAENFHFDREKRRWKGGGVERVHVALRLQTGQCHTDQAGRPMEVPLCALLEVSSFHQLAIHTEQFLFSAIIPRLRWRNLFCAPRVLPPRITDSGSSGSSMRISCCRIRFDGFSE